MVVRKSNERGIVDFGWLKSKHSFSFGNYFDPQHMGFQALRVINQDVVAPARGFDKHPHRDMEIITVVLRGSLEHKDSMGHTSVLRPGEIQRIRAGRGVIHSEYNASTDEEVEFLQIWIEPDELGLQPSYQQVSFAPDSIENQLHLVGGPQENEGVVSIHQDARLYLARLQTGKRINHHLSDHRHMWLQLVEGKIEVNGEEIMRGDGLSVSGNCEIAITAHEESFFLLFDLADKP